MKQKHGILIPSLAILALIFTVSACKKSDSGSNNQPSSMNIYLTDAPADYKAVWDRY